MDNQTNDSDSGWIEARLAALAAPDGWHPDGRRALAQLMERRERTVAAASPRWIQLSMAAAVLASIGLVVTLLPWRALWEGPRVIENRTSQPAEVAMPAPTSPPPESEQKPPENMGPGVIPPRATDAKAEPQYSDEARRAHIQGTLTAVQQPAQPAPEQEQKPVDPASPGVTPPKVVSSAQPNYTDEARQAHIQGKIILSVTVRVDGTARVDKIVQGLGYGLDEKAIEAVEKWRFVPGMKDGQPVDVQLPVTMNFKLY